MLNLNYQPEKLFDQSELAEQELIRLGWQKIMTAAQFLKAFPERVLELWEAERKAVIGIGGSEVAAILGESKFATNIDIYRRKIGEPEPPVDNITQFMFDAGHEMEEFVARAFVIRHPEWELVEDLRMCRHPLFPFMTGNIDYFMVNKNTGETAILECKYVTPDSAEMWRNGPPEYYVWQTRHYMSVWNVDHAFVTALWGNNPFQHGIDWSVRRDLDIEEEMIAAEAEFWEHVETRVPPTLKCHKTAALEAFMAANTPTNASASGVVTLSGDDAITAQRFATLEENYSNANKQAQEAKGRLEEARAQLILALGTSQTGEVILDDGTKYSVSVKPKSETVIDYDKLHTEFPAVFDEVVTPKATLEALKKSSSAAYKACTTAVPTPRRTVKVRAYKPE